MYKKVNGFFKKHRSLFALFQASLVCFIFLLNGPITRGQNIEVRVDDIMANKEPSLKKGKIEYFDILRVGNQQYVTSTHKRTDVFPIMASSKLLPELMTPVTINYSVSYQSSISAISIWVDGAHTLISVVVKDSSGITVYTGSGNIGTYQAPNIDSGTHTVYLHTNSGTVSETIYVN